MHVSLTTFEVSLQFESGAVRETVYVKAVTREAAEAYVRSLGREGIVGDAKAVDAYEAVSMGYRVYEVIRGDCAPVFESYGDDAATFRHP